MKKGLIFAATVASIAMTACTNDDVMDLNVENDEITFRTVMSTRGTVTSNGNISSVYVTSTLGSTNDEYFKEIEFKRNSGVYTSPNGTYRWPGFKTLNFYAHYPSSADLNATLNGLILTDVKPSLKISEQYDFVTAIATGDKSDTDGVSLQFSHNMSKIELRAVNTNPAYTFNIRGIRFGQFIADANFDLSKIGTDEDPWDRTCSKKDYTMTYFNPVILDGNSSASKTLMNADDGKNPAMLIPQKLTAWDKTKYNHGSYIGVLLQIRTAGGTQVFPDAAYKYAWAAIPIDFNLEAGKNYVFTLDFSNGAGVVAFPDDFSNEGDNEGPLDNVVDNSVAENHLGEDILGGEVKVIPSVGNWDTATGSTTNF